MSDALKISADALPSVSENGGSVAREWPPSGTSHPVETGPEADLLAELRLHPWQDVIARRFADQHPWLYKTITDRGRSLFLDFLPLRKGGRFLDVGSEWGQVAVPLARYGDVFCLDVAYWRLKALQEIARQENLSLHLICGRYDELPFVDGQFDLIIFNGILPAGVAGAPGKSLWDAQKAVLQQARARLHRGGLVYLGVENALSLKHLVDAPEAGKVNATPTFLTEELARQFSQPAGMADGIPVRAGSLGEYRSLLQEAGLEVMDIYGCFPDHRILRMMAPLRDVNAVLCELGIPAAEPDGPDVTLQERMDAVYRLLAKNGMAQHFCPSYGFVARKPQ